MMAIVKKEIRIRAPRETVWRYFSDADLLAGWLMRNNFNGEVGGEFKFFARPGHGWDGTLHCRLVEFDPPKKITFTWNANDIGAETLVTVELSEEGSATVVRLVHTNFEDAAYDVDAIVARHNAGWDKHLHFLELQAGEETRGGQESQSEIDWTKFDLHVAINESTERVLERWSTINGMESFFVEVMRITGPEGAERGADERAQPGDKYVWRWHNGRSVSGEYLMPDSENEVRFSFGESRVSVTALPYKSGTLLRLRQFDIPDTEEARMHIHTNCRAAWVYFLTVLKTLLEHGVDGRDKTIESGSSFSTYWKSPIDTMAN